MDHRSRFVFLLLVLTQAAHSVEEYVFRLYEVLAPVRFICGLLSNNPATGFIISNSALILFGLWCYLTYVRTGHRSAKVWAWLWILIELFNGIGHTAIALARGSYFPGVITAPVLLMLSIYLAFRMYPVQPPDRRAV